MNIRTHKKALIFSLISLTLTACSAEDPVGTSEEIPTQPSSTSTSYTCGDNFTNIDVPGEISNTDIPEGESHCFSFDAVADQTYTATLETLSGDANLFLYSSPDITSSAIASSEETGLTIDTVSVSSNLSATYYIEVYGLSASTYNLTLSSTAGGTSTSSNTKPVAVIPPTSAGALGQQTLLDSRASTDADGDTLTANWELISKPADSSLVFAPQTGDVVGFDADAYGDYTFQLTVDDAIIQSDPVTTTVSVQHTFTPLAFRVTDAEYDSANDRAVLVSAESQALYKFDPLTRVITEVPLTYIPTSVSVSPDGLFAAVGHNGNISYVDLSTDNVSNIFAVTAEIGDLVLDGNYVHAFPQTGSWVNIHSVDISTGTVATSSSSINDGTKARLHPNSLYIYGADNGISPSDIEKYDISTGPAVYLYDSPYHGDFSMCGNLWFSEGGQRIFTRCGNVFKSSADQNIDMTYNGALPNLDGSIVSLSHSSEQGKLALIENDSFDASLLLDTHVRFFEDSYLNEASTVALPYFTVGNESFSAHGEHIFYNSDGTQYLAVVKADSTSALSTDYAILTSPNLSDPSANLPPVADAGVSQAVVLGGSAQLNGSLSSDANADPLLYTWEISSAPVGSAASIINATTVSPQLTPDVAGTYTISLTVSDGSLTSIPDTINIQTVNSNEPFLLQTEYTVTDAEYSEALESLVMISPTDNGLYRFDTETYTHTKVVLPLLPTAVSVSPDGLYAAVGHNGWISYVDLQAMSVLKTFEVTTDVLDIILDGNGYVHAFPREDQHEYIRSVNIATEVETLSTGYSIYAGTLARLHPDGTSIYGADNGLSPADIEKYDISSGTAGYLYDSPYHGDYEMCGNLWLSEDGARIFTRCGNVFNSSTVQADDMTYNGALTNITTRITSLARTAEGGEIAIIMENDAFSPSVPSIDTQLHFYNYTTLTETGSVSLPQFNVEGQTYPSHGRFVFYNSNGTRYFSVVQADADAALLHDYGIYIH